MWEKNWTYEDLIISLGTVHYLWGWLGRVIENHFLFFSKYPL